MSEQRILVAIPVFNEQRYVTEVLGKVGKFAQDILVIDDGSTDHTPTLLALYPVEVIRHAENRGYGRSMQDAFRWAHVDKFDWLITMDCDEQHEPAAIPEFIKAIEDADADVISGSRYLSVHPENDCPPSDRRKINGEITREVNERLGLELTDAFCGFKAYRVAAVDELEFDIDGYDFPMQFWVQAVAAGLQVREIPVRLIYNDLTRSFGGPLDNPGDRIGHYRETLHRELDRCRERLPAQAALGIGGEATAAVEVKTDAAAETISCCGSYCE